MAALKRIIALIGIFFLITGCAVTNIKENDVCRKSAEYTRGWGRTTSVEKEYLKDNTSQNSFYYERAQQDGYSGIESAFIENNLLHIKIKDNALFEQYSAPVINNIVLTKYESHPLTGSFTPVGMLVWLTHPTEMNAFTFGCTERYVSDSDIDKSKKIKTGVFERRDVLDSHKMKITGFDNEIEFNTNYFFDKGIVKFDISKFVIESKIKKGGMVLKINCLDCDLQSADKAGINSLKTSIELVYDFSASTTSLENNKSPSEIKINPIIEDAKNTCKKLGFSEKTEKFGNCILRVTR